MKMLKKYWQLGIAILLLVVILVLLALGITTLNNKNKTIAEQQLVAENLNKFIQEDVGNMVTCYIVSDNVRAGEKITEDNITQITVPEKMIYTSVEKEIEVEVKDANGNPVVDAAGNVQKTKETIVENRIDAVMDSAFAIDKYFRVDMAKGTLLMNQYVIQDKLDATARYYQFVLDDYPTDINVGDYVDIRIRFTYGEDFIALPKIKIESMQLDAGLFTAVFTEEQINTYTSMLLDKAMYDSVMIYMLKYVDAGGQYGAESYYPVNDNISEVIGANPNIINLVTKEMQLERKQLNKIMGGTIESFDERELEDTTRQITEITRTLNQGKNTTIRARIRAEEEAARAAARGQ